MAVQLRLAFVAMALGALPALAETHIVTSPADSGEGSLRAAIAAASAASGPQTIVITGDDITLADTLSYTGSGSLSVVGSGQVLLGSGDFTLLETSATLDLSISGLTFQGPGGFSIEAQGTAKGIFMDVPETATGTATLSLANVTVSGTAGHGVHVSDCDLIDDCGSGAGGDGAGSPAGIVVNLMGVRIADTAIGRFDADGIRVDERGPGDIVFSAIDLAVAEAGADGVELDEGQGGDVIADIVAGVFNANGAYCDPALLTPFLPDPPEGAFDEGEMADTQVPGPITGSPDDTCFEREVDYHGDGSVEGYEFAIDVDDGLDIDEGGPGDVLATITSGAMTGNFDQGYDFDEDGPGDVDVTFRVLFAADNFDDGVKVSESGPGNVTALVSAGEFIGNGGAGLVFEEDDAGDLNLTIIGSSTVGNDGGALGIEAVQDGSGDGLVRVIDTEIADGVETDGAGIDPD